MAPSHHNDTPTASRGLGLAVVFALVGVVIVAVGWLIPSQFKSVPASVLAGAGRSGAGLPEEVRRQLDAGRPGAASLVADAALLAKFRNAELLVDRVAEYNRLNPEVAIWGESDPYLANAFKSTPPAADGTGGVLRQFLRADARRSVGEFLASSKNGATRAVFATRELQTYQQFLPLISAGGGPLEATIHLTAMLVQTQSLSDEVIAELRAIAEEAVRTGDTARLEAVYLDVLALGRRYNWGQLVAIVRGATSLKTIAQIRHLHNVAPDAAPVIAAACVITRQPDRVASYLVEFGPHGTEAMAFALHHGAGSLALLLRQQLAVDGVLTLPPAGGRGGLAQSATDPLVRFALGNPFLAVGAKIAAYLLGGFLLFLAGERVTALRRIELSPAFTATVRALGALVICLLLVIVNEPYLALGAQPSGYELRLVIPVLGSSTPADTMPDKTMSLDLPTITSIVFFFLVQALVFYICRLKLKDIEARKVSPAVKLRLAENEENLFDAGLYVGIAGTCISLVLQVLHVIQANLLAAYSSNLFGILCVAFIKIRHVRPFKQKLILEITEATGEARLPAAPAAPATSTPAAQPTRAG
jgi:hypothetical protein